jgi:hypothetical protein
MIPELAVSLVTAETIDQYVERLQRKGLRKLGEGAFSVVFDHPTMPNVAVKVIAFRDETYLKYVDLCKKHPNNPWLPKILGGPEAHLVDSKQPGQKQKVLFVFLEKLKPASNSLLSKACVYLGTLIDLKLSVPSDFEVFEPHEWKELAHQTRDSDVSILAAFLAQYPDNLDLGPHNFMARSTQVVFVDPVAPRMGHQLWAKTLKASHDT